MMNSRSLATAALTLQKVLFEVDGDDDFGLMIS